jgi:Fic family protein
MVQRSEEYAAFVPHPLPPIVVWTLPFVGALSDADRLIGRLAGETARLPNRRQLTRLSLAREAVLSSRIEGMQTTLGEFLAAQAGAAVKASPDELKEVRNYIAALEYGSARLGALSLSLRLVSEIHARLMKGVRDEHAAPGEFRRSQNWIGPAGCAIADATYVPPPPSEVITCLGAWEEFLRQRTLPPLVQIALAHYQFEAIHPFLEGNGRVGRLMIPLFLAERRILPTPLICMSAWFEATHEEYYRRLRGVSERGAWQEWLEYFLNGVARQSEDAVARAERINAQLAAWRARVTGASTGAPAMLLDLIAANPFITIKRASEEMNAAFTTAQRAVEKLERLKILSQVNDAQRNRLYCAKPLLNILEAPPQLHLRQPG